MKQPSSSLRDLSSFLLIVIHLTFSVTERPGTRRANVRLGALRGQEISLAIIADVKYFGACPGYFTFCGSGFQTRALHTLSRHSVTTCHQAALQPITILWFRKLIFFLEKIQTYIYTWRQLHGTHQASVSRYAFLEEAGRCGTHSTLKGCK